LGVGADVFSDISIGAGHTARGETGIAVGTDGTLGAVVGPTQLLTIQAAA